VSGAAGIEALHQSRVDLGEVGAAAQDHRTAAETAAGEARAQSARIHRGFHQAVQGRATDFEAIAQAGVGREQEAAEGTFVYMPAYMEHGVKAKTDVVMLLTMIKK